MPHHPYLDKPLAELLADLGSEKRWVATTLMHRMLDGDPHRPPLMPMPGHIADAAIEALSATVLRVTVRYRYEHSGPDRDFTRQFMIKLTEVTVPVADGGEPRNTERHYQ